MLPSAFIAPSEMHGKRGHANLALGLGCGHFLAERF